MLADRTDIAHCQTLEVGGAKLTVTISLIDNGDLDVDGAVGAAVTTLNQVNGARQTSVATAGHKDPVWLLGGSGNGGHCVI
jgi:hypothetical protein